jgi:radical SAM protein with 4Fe4S-binding SPASM domain
MLTNDDPGYVDLTSPAGIGIGALVYNYDGDVYASDEGRMLAEMGDKTFRLGNLHTDSYQDIILSEALLAPLEESFAESAPMCNDCAFEPFCGADPSTTRPPPAISLVASPPAASTGETARSSSCSWSATTPIHTRGTFSSPGQVR